MSLARSYPGPWLDPSGIFECLTVPFFLSSFLPSMSIQWLPAMCQTLSSEQKTQSLPSWGSHSRGDLGAGKVFLLWPLICCQSHWSRGLWWWTCQYLLRDWAPLTLTSRPMEASGKEKTVEIASSSSLNSLGCYKWSPTPFPRQLMFKIL
jgi:hypothetical protein